jgi:hypothetical protein
VQQRNEVIARGTGWGSYGTSADLVFAKAGYLLRGPNVLFVVVLIECGSVLGSFVHHYKLSHFTSSRVCFRIILVLGGIVQVPRPFRVLHILVTGIIC